MERKTNGLRDLDCSDFIEVKQGFEVVERYLDNEESTDEGILFLLKVSEEAVDFVPQVVQVLFGRYKVLSGRVNFERLYLKVLSSLTNYEFKELEASPLELLDFLEYRLPEKGVAKECEPSIKVLLNELLTKQPYLYSAWRQYYILKNESDLAIEKTRVSIQIDEELARLDKVHEEQGWRHRQSSGVLVPVEGKIRRGDGIADLGNLMTLSGLPPVFLQYAAFLETQGNISAAAIFLVTMAVTFQSFNFRNETCDFIVQLEILVRQALKKGEMNPEYVVYLLQNIEEFVGILEMEGGAKITRAIKVLKEKYSVDPPETVTVYDEIGSTKIAIVDIVGET